MANNYLMHYRTPGSLNGRTKYPGKYTPIGELAKGAKDFYNEAKQNGLGNAINNKVDEAKTYITEQVAPKVEEKATVAKAPKMIQDEMSKLTNSAIDNLTKPNTQTSAQLEDDFKTFIKNDIKDRINVKSNVAKLRAAKRMKGIADKAIYDPRTKEKLREAVSSDYKNIPQAIAKSITDPRNTKDYASIATDAAIPTYKGSKATTEDKFTTFMKNDIRDRMNERLKSTKEKGVNSFSKGANRFLNDPRVKNDIEEFRKDPGNIGNIISRKRVTDSAIDAAIPTYKGSKATTEDSFGKFIKNDIQDRVNDTTNKVKDKLKSTAHDLLSGKKEKLNIDVGEKLKSAKKKYKGKLKSMASKIFHDNMTNQNALMHYGRPGMKWGYNIFEQDYTPGNRKASSTNDYIYSEDREGVSNDITRQLAYNTTPKIKKLLNRINPTYNGRKASVDDDFFTFMKYDMQDRWNDIRKKQNEKYLKKVDRAVNTVKDHELLGTERMLMKKDPKLAAEYIKDKLKTDEGQQRYAKVAADVVIPTYKGSKATTEDSFGKFIKNDLNDRVNDLKKKIKDKLTSKKNIKRMSKYIQKGAKNIAKLIGGEKYGY